MNRQTNDDVRSAVRRRYAGAATGTSGCCEPKGEAQGCCCGTTQADLVSVHMGYSEDDIRAVPDGANLGLGCGNPVAIAALKPGERVLDLGSGGGFDCFLAAQKVGDEGFVIGVDMTPEMVAKARANARRGGYRNVEFRLGEIERLPVADGDVDVIMSNCVINLSPDKPAVFRESFRVLKPGGRLAVSDVVATAELPDEVKADMDLLAGCVSGAATVESLTEMLAEAGFHDIRIVPVDESREFIRTWVPGGDIADYVVSARIEAVKPE